MSILKPHIYVYLRYSFTRLLIQLLWSINGHIFSVLFPAVLQFVLFEVANGAGKEPPDQPQKSRSKTKTSITPNVVLDEGDSNILTHLSRCSFVNVAKQVEFWEVADSSAVPLFLHHSKERDVFGFVVVRHCLAWTV